MPRPKRTKNLVIVNTGVCLLVGPPAAEGGQAVRLIPGENDISSDVWESIKKNHTVRNWVALKMVVDAGEGKAKGLDKGLSGLTKPEQEARIETTDDVKLLAQWAGESQDPSTTASIRTRVNILMHDQGGDTSQGLASMV